MLYLIRMPNATLEMNVASETHACAKSFDIWTSRLVSGQFPFVKTRKMALR
jgi:hypothetical protein